jgi:hypothetical protein
LSRNEIQGITPETIEEPLFQAKSATLWPAVVLQLPVQNFLQLSQ